MASTDLTLDDALHAALKCAAQNLPEAATVTGVALYRVNEHRQYLDVVRYHPEQHGATFASEPILLGELGLACIGRRTLVVPDLLVSAMTSDLPEDAMLQRRGAVYFAVDAKGTFLDGNEDGRSSDAAPVFMLSIHGPEPFWRAGTPAQPLGELEARLCEAMRAEVVDGISLGEAIVKHAPRIESPRHYGEIQGNARDDAEPRVPEVVNRLKVEMRRLGLAKVTLQRVLPPRPASQESRGSDEECWDPRAILFDVDEFDAQILRANEDGVLHRRTPGPSDRDDYVRFLYSALESGVPTFHAAGLPLAPNSLGAPEDVGVAELLIPIRLPRATGHAPRGFRGFVLALGSKANVQTGSLRKPLALQGMLEKVVEAMDTAAGCPSENQAHLLGDLARFVVRSLCTSAIGDPSDPSYAPPNGASPTLSAALTAACWLSRSLDGKASEDDRAARPDDHQMSLEQLQGCFQSVIDDFKPAYTALWRIGVEYRLWYRREAPCELDGEPPSEIQRVLSSARVVDCFRRVVGYFDPAGPAKVVLHWERATRLVRCKDAGKPEIHLPLPIAFDDRDLRFEVAYEPACVRLEIRPAPETSDARDRSRRSHESRPPWRATLRFERIVRGARPELFVTVSRQRMAGLLADLGCERNDGETLDAGTASKLPPEVGINLRAVYSADGRWTGKFRSLWSRCPLYPRPGVMDQKTHSWYGAWVIPGLTSYAKNRTAPELILLGALLHPDPFSPVVVGLKRYMATALVVKREIAGALYLITAFARVPLGGPGSLELDAPEPTFGLAAPEHCSRVAESIDIALGLRRPPDKNVERSEQPPYLLRAPPSGSLASSQAPQSGARGQAPSSDASLGRTIPLSSPGDQPPAVPHHGTVRWTREWMKNTQQSLLAHLKDNGNQSHGKQGDAAADDVSTEESKVAFEELRQLGIVTESMAMVRVLRGIRLACAPEKRHALHALPGALITGETGTGKTLVANAIHNLQKRSGKLVVKEIGAYSPENAYAELHGTVDKYATGVGARAGLFRDADGGTLFLDELGEANDDVQGVLLGVMESGFVSPKGSAQRKQVDVFVVAATDMEWNVRPQLRYRLYPCIHVPALRERREDISKLAEHFLQSGVSSPLSDWLSNQAWSGNVRELRGQCEAVFRLTGRTRVATIQDFERAREFAAKPMDAITSAGGGASRVVYLKKPPNAGSQETDVLESLRWLCVDLEVAMRKWPGDRLWSDMDEAWMRGSGNKPSSYNQKVMWEWNEWFEQHPLFEIKPFRREPAKSR